jgi:hypothetical protein
MGACGIETSDLGGLSTESSAGYCSVVENAEEWPKC